MKKIAFPSEFVLAVHGTGYRIDGIMAQDSQPLNQSSLFSRKDR